MNKWSGGGGSWWIGLACGMCWDDNLFLLNGKIEFLSVFVHCTVNTQEANQIVSHSYFNYIYPHYLFSFMHAFIHRESPKQHNTNT